MYNFNLLVSFGWGLFDRAKREIKESFKIN